MQQHFPLLYLCIYNIVSLLWANHSCSAIHLLTSFFFLFSSLLWLCSLVYSLCLVFNKFHVIFCLSQKGLNLSTSCFFFITLTERLLLPLSTGRRPPHYMYSDMDVNSLSFRERPILLFPTWCPCFPSPLFSFPALCCHPFHQDCLPGASGVHLCFTAWLQGQKHPPYSQTFTYLLGLNLSSPTLKWCLFMSLSYLNYN